MSTIGRLVIFIVVAVIILAIVGAFFKFLLKWAIIAIIIIGILRFVAPKLLNKN